MAVLAKARKAKKPPHQRGSFTFRTPKVGVELSMGKNGHVREGCPLCHATLYNGHMALIHDATRQYIVRHVKRCELRKKLLDILSHP